MAESFDVVIVGGAAMGSAAAYFLTHDLGFNGRVALVERDPSFRRASTALSAASIRQQFSTPENIRLSAYGVRFIRDELGQRFGADASVSFREAGYLLLSPPAGVAVARANHAVQKAEGADVVLLEPRNSGPLSMALDRWRGAGRAGGERGGLVRRLRSDGADAGGGPRARRGRDHGRGLRLRPDRRSRHGGPPDRRPRARLRCGRDRGRAAGGRRRGPRGRSDPGRAAQALRLRGRLPPDDSGHAADRGHERRLRAPGGERFICGVSPPEADDPRADGDFEVDHRLFDEVVWPALAARIPAFAALKVVGAWAGHYDYNTLDQNALIGAHPAVPNLVMAAGFSGHGIQQAPAVGRAVAEILVHGRSTSLDLDVFAPGRVSEGRAVRELNVI